MQFEPTLLPAEQSMVSSSSGTIGLLMKLVFRTKYLSTYVHDSRIHLGV